MSNPFYEVANELKDWQENSDTFVLGLVQEEEALLIDLNLSQLEAGINADGSEIEPEYTEYTKIIKRSEGRPWDRVALYDEGKYYKGWFIVYGADYFAFGSDDSKARSLERKYGKGMYGLTKENLQEAIDVLRPLIIKLFSEKILSKAKV